jgi:hypothetical protein
MRAALTQLMLTTAPRSRGPPGREAAVENPKEMTMQSENANGIRLQLIEWETVPRWADGVPS